MEQHIISTERALGGSFRDYVRGVLADHSERARSLRARRMRWLRRVGHETTAAKQRWENDGGSMW